MKTPGVARHNSSNDSVLTRSGCTGLSRRVFGTVPSLFGSFPWRRGGFPARQARSASDTRGIDTSRRRMRRGREERARQEFGCDSDELVVIVRPLRFVPVVRRHSSARTTHWQVAIKFQLREVSPSVLAGRACRGVESAVPSGHGSHRPRVRRRSTGSPCTRHRRSRLIGGCVRPARLHVATGPGTGELCLLVEGGGDGAGSPARKGPALRLEVCHVRRRDVALSVRRETTPLAYNLTASDRASRNLARTSGTGVWSSEFVADLRRRCGGSVLHVGGAPTSTRKE